MDPKKSRAINRNRNYKAKAAKSTELKLFFDSQEKVPKGRLIDYLALFQTLLQAKRQAIPLAQKTYYSIPFVNC